MNPIFSETFTVTAQQSDRFGRATPAALLYFMQEVAGRHCSLLAVDHDTLSRRSLFWAVTRSRVQITRLPRQGETVTVETWPMPTTRVAFPRSVVARDETGRELFRAISLWVLMDSRTRALILPGKSGITVEGTLTGSELAIPHGIALQPMQNFCTRTVGFSLLDRNGHMNNTRYLDWVADLLDSEFHREHPVQEFTVCWLSEAREGDAVTLGSSLTDGPVLSVEASRGDTRVFSAQMIF